MLAALGNLLNPDKMLQVLLNQRDLSGPGKTKSLEFFDKTLNTSQQEAVRFALASPEAALIHGPSGIYIERSYFACDYNYLILFFFFPILCDSVI